VGAVSWVQVAEKQVHRATAASWTGWTTVVSGRRGTLRRRQVVDRDVNRPGTSCQVTQAGQNTQRIT